MESEIMSSNPKEVINRTNRKTLVDHLADPTVPLVQYPHKVSFLARKNVNDLPIIYILEIPKPFNTVVVN